MNGSWNSSSALWPDEFIFYCCITNSHKLSSLKQHTLVSHSLFGSGIWTQPSWLLCLGLTDCSPGASQGPSLIWGPIGETSTSRLTQVIGGGDFIVVSQSRVLLCAGCWLKAAWCPRGPPQSLTYGLPQYGHYFINPARRPSHSDHEEERSRNCGVGLVGWDQGKQEAAWWPQKWLGQWVTTLVMWFCRSLFT